MSEWSEYGVDELIGEDVLAIGDGYRAKNSELSSAGIPFARAGNLNGGFDFSNCDFFPFEHLQKVGDKRSQVGDVVFTSKGTVGRFAFVDEEVPNFVFSPQLCYWRSLNNSVIHPRFLFYWMQSYAFRAQIYAVKGQTDMADYVSLRDQRQMSVLLPNVEIQHSIAKILSTLDQKIALLRRQNETLETIAQTLFKRWFVEFEFPCLPADYVLGASSPPPSGREGEPNLPGGASSPPPFGREGEPGMAETCTYRAVGGLPAPQPGRCFIYVLRCEDDSFYIGITEDLYRRWHEHKTGRGAKWTKAHPPVKVIHYEEFASREEAAAREKWLKTGFGRKWLKREFAADRLRQAGAMQASELGEIPVGWEVGRLGDIILLNYGKALKTEDRKNGEYPVVGSSGIVGTHSNFLVEGPGIVIGRKGTIGQVIWLEKNFHPIDTTYFIEDNLGVKHLYFHYIILQRQRFDRIGSDSAVPGLNRNLALDLDEVIPKIELIGDFNKKVKPVFDKMRLNKDQIQTLTRTRDTLLPKLMSGEIRIPMD